MKYSLIIPIYKNEASIPRLLQTLTSMHETFAGKMEVVFVVDGSPDQSYRMLQTALHTFEFPVQLLAHSRNFGSFPAIRSGLKVARGKYFSVMAADMQEPPELIIEFFKILDENQYDVVIGTRNSRNDPLLSQIFSNAFWGLYRRLVVRDIPKGGVDVFGCNQIFRDQLLKLEESRSSLVALIFWLGFQRKFIHYERQIRQEGKSAWTFRKKFDYMMDSIFAFTDYPIRLLMRVGAFGSALSILVAFLILIARLTGLIDVPGYTAVMLIVIFLGTLNLFALGLVGTYAWRAYENSKQRPLAVISLHDKNTLGDSNECHDTQNF